MLKLLLLVVAWVVDARDDIRVRLFNFPGNVLIGSEHKYSFHVDLLNPQVWY